VIATGASENDRLDFFIYDDGPKLWRISQPRPLRGWPHQARRRSAGNMDLFPAIPIGQLTSMPGPRSPQITIPGRHQPGGAPRVRRSCRFVQYYRLTHTNATPSPALVKRRSSTPLRLDDSLALIRSNMDEGWGRVDVGSLVDGSRSFDFLDQSVLLATGQVTNANHHHRFSSSFRQRSPTQMSPVSRRTSRSRE